MSNTTVLAEDLPPAIINDICRPNFKGYYELTFVSDNPFLSRPDFTLSVQIDAEGKPSMMFPEGVTTQEQFVEKLKSHLYVGRGVFRSNSWVLLTQKASIGSPSFKNWAWGIETNGHLTPKAHVEDGELLIGQGWTINHNSEVLMSFAECLSLLQTSAEKTIEHSNNKFTITMNIDGGKEVIKAKKNPSSDEFALEREDYPEMYLSFKNAAYVGSEPSLVVDIGSISYRWKPIDGLLVPEAKGSSREGWGISFTPEEAEILMEKLTKDAPPPTNDLNPDPRNIVASDSQEALVTGILGSIEDGENHLVNFYIMPANGEGVRHSTRIDKTTQGYVVEIPDLLDYIINERDKEAITYVIVQTLDPNVGQSNNVNFFFTGYSLEADDTLVPLSDEETERFI